MLPNELLQRRSSRPILKYIATGQIRFYHIVSTKVRIAAKRHIKRAAAKENLLFLLQRPFSLMVQAFVQLACPLCLSLLDDRKDQTEGSQNKWSNDI